MDLADDWAGEVRDRDDGGRRCGGTGSGPSRSTAAVAGPVEDPSPSSEDAAAGRAERGLEPTRDLDRLTGRAPSRLGGLPVVLATRSRRRQVRAARSGSLQIAAPRDRLRGSGLSRAATPTPRYRGATKQAGQTPTDVRGWPSLREAMIPRPRCRRRAEEGNCRSA